MKNIRSTSSSQDKRMTQRIFTCTRTVISTVALILIFMQRIQVISSLDISSSSSSSFLQTNLFKARGTLVNHRTFLKRKNSNSLSFSNRMSTSTPASTVDIANNNIKNDSEWISPLVKNNNIIPTIPFPVLLATVGIALPIWSVTILPITIAYQVGRTIVKKIGFGTTKSVTPVIDSGYVADPTSIIPQSKRKYDLVVLGATGFTGRLAVRHLLKTYGTKGTDIKWAIAGRNEEKLKSILIDVATECNVEKDVMTSLLDDIDIIIVDTSLPSTMPKLVSNAKCIATTAGPYTFYGNSVIEFCCKYGTHYVDITGEIDWIRLMIHTWSSTAKQTGAKLIPFCGHE
jgi:Saccharopine dehydrogenase NADP binding domain